MKTLYVETNFAIAIAKGQDAGAARFLANVPESFQLLIPGVCFMEALSVLNREGRERNELGRVLSRTLGEVKRDQESAIAIEFARLLDDSLLSLNKYFEQFSSRLYEALGELSRKAALIPLNREVVEYSLSNILVASPTDNLILSCVLWHAGNHPADFRAFVSGNTKDFNRAPVSDVLARAQVKYFSRVDGAEGWLVAQTIP